MLRDLLNIDCQPHLIATLFGPSNKHVAADFCLAAPENAHLRAETRLIHLLRTQRPVVTVAHGSEPLRYLAPLPRSLRGALVYHRIGVGMPQLHRQPNRRLHRWLLRRADAIVAISQDVAAEVRSLDQGAARKLCVIPNGRDPEIYFPPDRRPVGPAPPTAIFVGALTAEKRPELFVKACRQGGHEVRGLIVGDGPLRHDLERATRGSNISVLGPRYDVPELLRASDVFCFTSLPFQEGMPGVLIEAAMSGLPIVATDVAGVRDVVSDGITGVIVRHDDERGYCEAAAGLFADRERSLRLGDAATERSREFTMETCALRWRQLLGGLTER